MFWLLLVRFLSFQSILLVNYVTDRICRLSDILPILTNTVFDNHRISYKLSLLTWKALHTAEPSYLSELMSPYVPARTLCSSNTCLLAIPTGVTSHFSSRSFSASAPSTWNSLPVHIRSLENLSIFKRQLKPHFFQSAFTV